MRTCLKAATSSAESGWGGTLISQGCTRPGWESLKHSSHCTGAILALYTWQEHHGALCLVLRQRLVDMGMEQHHTHPYHPTPAPCSPICPTCPPSPPLWAQPTTSTEEWHSLAILAPLRRPSPHPSLTPALPDWMIPVLLFLVMSGITINTTLTKLYFW